MAETVTVKTVNKQKTIQNILDRCNARIGFSINMDKFNKKREDVEFLMEAAEFVGAKVVYA